MAIASRNRNKIDDAIRNRTDFAVASMSGTRISARYPVQAGWLNESTNECKRLQSGIARGDVTYVVYSFGTPIGWVENGMGYVPAVKYSPTTSQHQTIARVAFRA